MKKIVCMLACFFIAGNVHASLIDFEGFSSSVTNVSTTVPYTEDGFTITPTNADSAVFDSTNSSDMVGNSSDWFGFSDSNTPSLTRAAGTFGLLDVLIGPSTVGGGVVDMSITGNVSGGGTLTSTFSGLTTATTAALGWNNLLSVSFSASDDAGIDDIRVTASTVPAPASVALLGLGLVGIGFFRRKRSV